MAPALAPAPAPALAVPLPLGGARAPLPAPHGAAASQHADAAGLARLRAEHLKAAGDAAVKAGQYGEAAAKYAECVRVAPDAAGLDRVHSNAALALTHAGRYEPALLAARAAAALAPAWSKPRWREAEALRGLKRYSEALGAYLAGLQLRRVELLAARPSPPPGAPPLPPPPDVSDPDAAAFRHAARRAVESLTREQLAEQILGCIERLEASGVLPPPRHEDVSREEKVEALFKATLEAHANKPTPGDYTRYLLRWLLGDTPTGHMEKGIAYLQRSRMFRAAKCYTQAAEDARAAIRLYAAEEAAVLSAAGVSVSGIGAAAAAAPGAAAGAGVGTYVECQLVAPGTTRPFDRHPLRPLAWAWECLGRAHVAQAQHPDRDWPAALAAFHRARALDPTNREYQRACLDYASMLSNEQMSAVLASVRGSGAAAALDLGVVLSEEEEARAEAAEATAAGLVIGGEGTDRDRPAAGLAAGGLRAGPGLYRVEAEVLLPRATLATFKAAAREALRAGAAGVAGVPKRFVLIESVRPIAPRDPDAPADRDGGGTEPPPPPPGLEVRFQVQVGANHAVANAYAAALLADPQAAVGGLELVRWVGPVAAGANEAAAPRVVDIHALLASRPATQSRRGNGNEPADPAAGGTSQPAPAVPGRPKLDLELPYRSYRLVKADGRPTERVDKHPFCMSRVYYHAKERPEQASEVVVMALAVPPGLPPGQLCVDIRPRSVRVAHAATDEVYLQGELERGVVPEECIWEAGTGTGPEGCVLHLRKMNLELLASAGEHTRSWWPRLMTHHIAIAWDDYEKDYSDLPAEIMAQHAAIEAEQAARREVDQAESVVREALQERDDVRKRARQERLHALRGHALLDWVALNRLKPPPDDMPAMPGSRDSGI